MAYDFSCDSLGTKLSQQKDSFFWCLVCRSLESTLDRDVSKLTIDASSYTSKMTDLSSSVSSSLATPQLELNDIMDDFKYKADSIIPNMGDVVQITGANQTSFNEYHKSMRDMISVGDPTTLARMGMDLGTNALTQEFPTSFLTKQSGSASGCFGDLLNSYQCGEINSYLIVIDILDYLDDIGSFVNSLVNGIQSYVSMGCSETKGLEMEAKMNSALDQIPLDSNYEFDTDGIFDSLGASTEYTDNLKNIKSEIGPTIDSALDRISL
jgi:hypothetical protein